MHKDSENKIRDEKSKKNLVVGMLVLQVAVLVHSFSGVFSKLASVHSFWSLEYWTPFALSMGCTFVYALLWQIALKRLPLITAFLGKSVGTIWVAIWGCLIFKEVLTPGKIVGLILVAIGSLVVVTKDE